MWILHVYIKVDDKKELERFGNVNMGITLITGWYACIECTVESVQCIHGTEYHVIYVDEGVSEYLTTSQINCLQTVQYFVVYAGASDTGPYFMCYYWN